MVAPLDIERVVIHEAVHDAVALVSAIVYIAHQMQMVHCKALDERGEGRDEVFGGPDLYDGLDDAHMVLMAARLAYGGGAEELIDDVGIRFGHGLAHLGARVEARKIAREADEAQQRLEIPFAVDDPRLLEARELLARIVDERAEIVLLDGGELMAEGGADAFAHDARAVVEDVQEGLVLAVDIAHEVLGALREVEDCLEVDDLGVRRLDGGELLGEEQEILALFGGHVSLFRSVHP